MPADGLTKALLRQKHDDFVRQLRLVDITTLLLVLTYSSLRVIIVVYGFIILAYGFIYGRYLSVTYSLAFLTAGLYLRNLYTQLNSLPFLLGVCHVDRYYYKPQESF